MEGFEVIEWLDDSGLGPYEFRVLLRISRRYQDGIKGESIEAIAQACKTSKEKCRQCIESLLQQGFLAEENGMSPEEIKFLLCGKTPQKIDTAHHACDWCKGTTFALQQHHYPISKARGGKEVVSICGSCHCEFHWLEQSRTLKPTFTFPWTVESGNE